MDKKVTGGTTRKYRVGFVYTEVGTMTVEAETAEKAEDMVNSILGDVGLEDGTYDCRDRDYETSWSEEV